LFVDSPTGHLFDFRTVDTYGLDCLYYVYRFGGALPGNLKRAEEMFKFVNDKVK